jgi:mycothiol synthase
MHQREIVGYYSRTGCEEGRLDTGVGRLEYVRSKEIIQRYLSPAPQVIVDVGGATGAYSLWLSERGHVVHLVDLVPRHVERAREKAGMRGVDLESVGVGDVRSLPYADGWADVVLLMGPLYHLVDRDERLRALREGGRVLKEGGRLICAAISRYASLLDGFRARLFDAPEYEGIVDRDLREGQHRNPVIERDFFTTAYFHKPRELREEIAEAGLVCDRLVGVEGPLCAMNEMREWLDGRGRYYELALKYTRAVEEEESLLGASFHLLAVARKPSTDRVAGEAGDDRAQEDEEESYAQLHMVWPERRLSAPPAVRLPPGYALRTYRPGDETRFYQVMELAGWPGWDDEKLRPWLSRILPEGWFMAIHQESGEIVATAMALHNYTERHPFWGELGWLAGDPAHAGKGLGMAVSAAVTARLIDAGYRHIHLYTEDWRLPALKIYLKLGYVPSLYTPEMPERWREICAQLRWPFTPEEWGARCSSTSVSGRR